MKYKLLIYITSLFLSCLLLGCNDKTEDFNGPYSLIVTGSAGVTPGSTETYRLAPYENPTSYTWSITGPATIVGSTTGLVVKVAFSAVGSVKLTVTNGTDKALVPITVSDVSPDAEVTLAGTGVLKMAKKDTVFLTYPAPLKASPVITMLTATDTSQFNTPKSLAFVSGTLGPIVKIDDMTYYAIYTAGPGNGIPEALITGAVSSDDYGADKVDSLYIQLFEVDNIAPLADLSYSTLLGNSGTKVTVTAKFTEPVTFENPADSALHISFSGAGVSAETDTLFATDNALVYTYTYTITGSGNGTVTATLSNVTDLGGNTVAAVTNTGGKLIVDNTVPTVSGSASDGGNFASIEITSSENGTGDYLVLADTIAAPTTIKAFFGATGILSGTVNVTAGSPTPISALLGTGSYNVYFVSEDKAGNYSNIDSKALTMD